MKKLHFAWKKGDPVADELVSSAQNSGKPEFAKKLRKRDFPLPQHTGFASTFYAEMCFSAIFEF
ncbi:hypothetical protein CLOSTMETH_00596 [[Clostridium] methylpentosum DSM 5476]|uniref:Uncharacterized protein n=1 Tax=[Clostridium] methylpentosum DSM 5476 TaxID=537013 RepID=C0E9U5_9FIRM|nr:hypothetical protein CLOSTMETH_00596 [[Clostridium] methylpentosum DSM 5476]